MNDNDKTIWPVGLPTTAYEFTTDPELTALTRRHRIKAKTDLISRGLSSEFADLLLDSWERAMHEAFEKMVMTEGSGQPFPGSDGNGFGGILSLLDENT